MGEDPVGNWVDATLGVDPLDDLLELPPDPPDFRSFVVETLAVVVDEPADERLVPVGNDDTDTVGLVFDPPDAVADVV